MLALQLFKKVITQDRFGDHVQEVGHHENMLPGCAAAAKRAAPHAFAFA